MTQVFKSLQLKKKCLKPEKALLALKFNLAPFLQ